MEEPPGCALETVRAIEAKGASLRILDLDLDTRTPTGKLMLNLLGSHDMARFLTLARGDTTALRLATLFQMTYPGAPSIYYGDEVGLTTRSLRRRE